jgi:Mg-chelatase subunit ChlD
MRVVRKRSLRWSKQIYAELGGTYLRLEELKSGLIVSAVRDNLGYASERRIVQ